MIPLGRPPDVTYLHIFLHLLLLVSELTKSVNDQTWGGRAQVSAQPLTKFRLPPLLATYL